MEHDWMNLDLGDLIRTSFPYNILNNIIFDKAGNLSASVKNDFLSHKEGGPISAAEFGRHAGVLGSFQLAKDLKSENSHYFLVTHASLNRSKHSIYKEENFFLKSETISVGKRQGKVYCQMQNTSKKVVWEGTFNYAVLKPDFFDRLYSPYYTEHHCYTHKNPYVERKGLKDITIDNYQAIANYGKIQSDECKGHFDNYPCLPISILGNLFSELGIHLFNRYATNNYNKVVVSHAKIHANNLAFHGDDLFLDAQITEILPDGNMCITTRGIVNRKPLVEAGIEFKGIF